MLYRHCFSTCFIVCPQKGSGKSGWLEIKWHTSAYGLCVHSIKKNTNTLVVASKEIGLEVNADKTKHMVMCGDQNAGRGYRMKVGNSSFERVEEFKYQGTTIMNQN